MSRIAVYGASGYTGRLVAGALAADGHDVLAVGRSERRLREAAPDGADVAVAALDDPAALVRALDGCAAVVGCAGPFLTQGAPVLEAAITAGVPYADTAAEQAWARRVFERYGPLADRRGIAVVPATGLNFLPGDLACALAARDLGPLRALDVAYAIDRFRMGRGTLRSALAGARQRPLIYRDGDWRFGLARPGRFDFPPPFGRRLVVPFPAGEIVTAPRHVDTRAASATIAAPELVIGAAETLLGRVPVGPPEEARRRARWIVVAVASAQDGRRRQAAVRGADVYATTAACAAHAAALLAGGGIAGALAPAQAFAPAAFLAHVGSNTMSRAERIASGTRRGRELFWALMPKLKDVTDAIESFGYNLGFTRWVYEKGILKQFFDRHPYWLFLQPPKYGRFNFIEKFEYLAVWWGNAVMIVSGFFLWATNLSFRWFPLWVYDIFKIIHSYEAILAFLAIIIWHLYNVHLTPDVFPMSRVWLDGTITGHELRANHPLEYEAILETRRRARLVHRDSEVQEKEMSGGETPDH